jgi:SCP-2 sterol transfer family
MLARLVALAMGLRFDPARAEGLNATLGLRLRILGGRRILPLTLRVRDGRCEVTPGSSPDAGAQVAIGLLDMIRVGLGVVPWPGLLSSGRLELTGDPFLALRFPTLFRLRAVGSPAHGREQLELGSRAH